MFRQDDLLEVEYLVAWKILQHLGGPKQRWVLSSSFGTVAQRTFKQILTGDARVGFGAITKSVGGVVGLMHLLILDFIFTKIIGKVI